LFNGRSLRHVGCYSLAAVASLLAWLACAAGHVSGWWLLHFPRESALHHALHARPIVALRARLLKLAAILSLGSAVPSAGHNRFDCLPGWVRALPSLRPNYSFKRTADVGLR